MRFRRSPYARPLLVLIAAAGVVAAPGPAEAEILAYEAATPDPTASNCYPFGGTGFITGNQDLYFGFIYKTIPAFSVDVGDAIAFDLVGVNDTDIIVDIALATTTVDGGVVPNGAFVTVAEDATPLVARGDTTQGNFELSFPIEVPFSHGGGGLIVRIRPQGSFATDASCDATLGGASFSDASGYFVQRVYQDADGVDPWSGDQGSIGEFALGLDDLDLDGVLNADDLCPELVHPDQDDDLDGDEIGDPCDDDVDGDTILNVDEPGATDLDDDVDARDLDSDEDGVLDADEAGDDDPLTPPVDSDDDTVPDYLDLDSDADGVLDGADVCRIVFDPQQIDADGTGQGDACAGDDDGDGVDDGEDNCPQIANDDQADADSDDLGDACVADDDADVFLDADDNCPVDANPDQADFDADGLGDVCDPETTGAGGSSGEGGSPAATTATTSGAGGADEPADDGGCQVSQAGGGAGSWGAFVAATAALLGLGARRKRR